MATSKDSRDTRTAAQVESEKSEAEKAERQRVADSEAAQQKAADPETKFRDGEYVALQPIEHNQQRIAVGEKVKLTAKEAESLASVGAIKV